MPQNDEPHEEHADQARDVEQETEEVPIGIPVDEAEFRRLKEEAAKPSPELADGHSISEHDDEN